ncbi:MAG TPA: HEXXH motif-containing putative peptide modification protein [Dongiaceae bacterium]|nr:HEXXH motif-containing putative peptide modification protein [Dongiaceae bacterium]
MTVSADLLWRDVEVFEHLHRKTAATLCALERTVRQRSIEGSGDFLAACPLVLDEATAPQLCTAPSTLAWSHRAYDLVRAAGTGECNADRLLSTHLDSFKLFAAGGALLAGADHRFVKPLVLGRPVTIPGTRLRLSALPVLVLHGVEDGALLVSTTETDIPRPLSVESAADGMELRRMPVARHGGAEVMLGAEVFDLPGIEPAGARSAVPPEPSYQERCAPMVELALAAVARHEPELFAQMRLALSAVAVKPRASGEFQSMSFSDFPGAFIVSYVAHPYLIAESMVHELHHNRLFAIESTVPLVEDTDAGAALYYSPFRPDPRPIRGLLHGLYVFTAVWRFWDKVRHAADIEPVLRTFAIDRTFRIAFQLAVACKQLATHRGLTAEGQAVFAILARDVEDIVTAVDRSGHGMDSPAAFCSEDGVMRIEVDERTGAALTVADALHLQRHRFAEGIR